MSILYTGKKRTLLVSSWSTPRPVWTCYDFSTFKIPLPQQFFREQLNVTNTTFSRILNEYWPRTEGDSRLFGCVVNVLFFLPLTSVDSCRCDSYCLARFFQNLPAPPKHYSVFDVFADFKSFTDESEMLGPRPMPYILINMDDLHSSRCQRKKAQTVRVLLQAPWHLVLGDRKSVV